MRVTAIRIVAVLASLIVISLVFLSNISRKKFQENSEQYFQIEILPKTCPFVLPSVKPFIENRLRILKQLGNEMTDAHAILIYSGHPSPRDIRGGDMDYEFEVRSVFKYLAGSDAENCVFVLEKSGYCTLFVQPRNEDGKISFYGKQIDANDVEEFSYSAVDTIVNLKSTLDHKKINTLLSFDETDMLELGIFGYKYDSSLFRKSLDEILPIKTENELEILEFAANVTLFVHKLLISTIQNTFESEIRLKFYAKYLSSLCSCVFQAFTPMISFGNHSAILDYQSRQGFSSLGWVNESVVLIDIGAKCMGYNSDLTRSYPFPGENPRFNVVYNMVMNIYHSVLDKIIPGASMRQIELFGQNELISQLLNNGFINSLPNSEEMELIVRFFMPHSLSHHVGIHVHDAKVNTLKPQMVVSLEPGIYFFPHMIQKAHLFPKINKDLVEKYSDFGGVRMEDMILVTDGPPRILGKS